MNTNSMTHRALCESIKESARPLRSLLRHAISLLVEFDDGAWLRDEKFRSTVLVDEPHLGSVRVSSQALRNLAREGLENEDWVHEHGSAAFGVLWLAAHLAEGELGRLLDRADSETADLISSVMQAALGHRNGGAVTRPGPEDPGRA